MRRILTCAAALLLVAGLAPSYAEGGPGGRPASAGARGKGPKTVATTKGKASGPKSTATAHGKSSAPGQQKKTTTNPAGAATADAAEAKSNVPRSAKLQEKLQGKLGDMSLDDAAEGFKNQGQFVAAVNAADRLDVDFAEFKAKMVDEGNSLGQTIQFFNPEADADAEVEAAESQARQDLK
jgi:hypothetical protein